jgi:hypothetical protein
MQDVLKLCLCGLGLSDYGQTKWTERSCPGPLLCFGHGITICLRRKLINYRVSTTDLPALTPLHTYLLEHPFDEEEYTVCTVILATTVTFRASVQLMHWEVLVQCSDQRLPATSRPCLFLQ